jgi:hypothetical protein
VVGHRSVAADPHRDDEVAAGSEIDVADGRALLHPSSLSRSPEPLPPPAELDSGMQVILGATGC